MRLVWHIVRKDARRFALPWFVWIVFIVAPFALFLATPNNFEGHVASSISAMTAGMAMWVRGVGAVQLLFGYLLGGSLVLEDSLIETNGFWPTRPIASGRLLIAKILAAVLLLIGAPILAVTPVWMACGFSAGDIAAAAWEFAIVEGAVVLLALAIASAARDLAQFVFFTILFVFVCLASLWLTKILISDPVRVTKDFVALWVAPVAAFILVQQFLTRNRPRAGATFGLAVVVSIGLRTIWPWDGFLVAEHHRVRFEPRPEDRGAAVVMEPTFRKSRPNWREMPNLFGQTAWAADAFYAPVLAKTPDGVSAMSSSGFWEGEAGLRLLGFKHESGPLRCQLIGTHWSKLSEENPEFTGFLEIWLVRPRLMGEVPLRIGEHFRSGASRTRVLSLERNEGDRLDAIFIEERNSQAAARAGWGPNWSPGDAQRAVYIDQYFLVNRTKQKAQVVHASEVAVIDMNAIVLQYRRLFVAGDDDWAGSSLVKLRYECDHRFERPLEVHGVTFTRPAPSP